MYLHLDSHTCIHVLISLYLFQVSLSSKAERVLEGTVQQKQRGDVIYFWARVDMDGELAESEHALTFWSMCDILNAGNCRCVDILNPL